MKNIGSKKNQNKFNLDDFSYEAVWKELFYYIRVGGMKYNAFLPPISQNFNTPPVYEKIFSGKEDGSDSIPTTKVKYCVDVKEILGHDRAMNLAAILLLKKIKEMNPQPQVILALETTGFTLTGAILALHDLFFPKEKLEACYIRKNKKIYDLSRLMDGTRDFSGKSAVFVDDFSNRGKTFSYVAEVAKENKINLQKGIFVVRQDEKVKSFHPDIPIEGLFLISQIRNPEINIEKENHKYTFEHNKKRLEPITKKEIKDPLWQIDFMNMPENAELSRADIELVKLAKDTAIMSVVSEYKEYPNLVYDGKGSFGYLPFLDKHLQEKRGVVVKINKREFKHGKWINRQRGCVAWGSSDMNNNTTAHNVVSATITACSKSLRLDATCPRGPFHKPIWPGEIGGLSFFIFVVEKVSFFTIDDLKKIGAENQNSEWGLLVRKEKFCKIIFDSLDEILGSEKVAEILFSNLSDGTEVKSFSKEDKIEIIKLSGRWLWSPERPKKYFFNHI